MSQPEFPQEFPQGFVFFVFFGFFVLFFCFFGCFLFFCFFCFSFKLCKKLSGRTLGRQKDAKSRSWGGASIYIYIYICVCIYIYIYICIICHVYSTALPIKPDLPRPRAQAWQVSNSVSSRLRPFSAKKFSRMTFRIHQSCIIKYVASANRIFTVHIYRTSPGSPL